MPMLPNRIFVTAISTDSGKTAISGLLCEALGYDYWKPIQAGEPTDTNWISSQFPNVPTYPNSYFLKSPMSPHAAAKIDGVQVELDQVHTPSSDKLLIEGAGGLLVPLSDELTIADLIVRLDVPVVLVSNYYLGSINHTLLSINEMKRRGIEVAGLIFNGEENLESKRVILEMTGLEELYSLPRIDFDSKEEVKGAVEDIRKVLG